MTSPSRVRAASPYGRVGSPNAQATQAPAPAAVLVRVAAPPAPQQPLSPSDHSAIGTRMLRTENHVGVAERDLEQRADTADAPVIALNTCVRHLEQTIKKHEAAFTEIRNMILGGIAAMPAPAMAQTASHGATIEPAGLA